MEKHSSEHRREREKSPDVPKDNHFEHAEAPRDAFEHADQLARRHEHDTKAAESEAYEHAESAEQAKHAPEEQAPAVTHRGPLTKKQLGHAYDETMSNIQQEMPPSKRTFSKVIHNKAVEKTSDALAATVARPNALLAGSIGAFALTLAIYIFAKTMGYRLSGFEPIAAFVAGWLAGCFYDYFRVMVTGKK